MKSKVICKQWHTDRVSKVFMSVWAPKRFAQTKEKLIWQTSAIQQNLQRSCACTLFKWNRWKGGLTNFMYAWAYLSRAFIYIAMYSPQTLGRNSTMPTILPTIKLQGKHLFVINLKYVSSSTIYLQILKYLSTLKYLKSC